VTGPEERLTTIKVMRVPDNPLIKGTFWLDDVQLTPVPTAENLPHWLFCLDTGQDTSSGGLNRVFAAA
jgi:hypothetical protein